MLKKFISSIIDLFRGKSSSIDSSNNNGTNQNVIGDHNTVSVLYNEDGNNTKYSDLKQLINNYIENHNMRLNPENDKIHSLAIQGFHLALDISNMILSEAIDEKKVPRLNQAFICMEEDLKYPAIRLPPHLRADNIQEDEILPIKKAYELVMEKELETALKRKGPNTRQTNFF